MRPAPRPGRIRSSVLELAELVLPRRCAGCSASGVRWCTGCATALSPDGGHHRLLDGRLSVWSVASYDGPVREALNAWKDHGRADLTPVLAAALAPLLADVLAGALADGPTGGPRAALVPVPSRPGARRARGRDPVGELCRASVRRLDRAADTRRPLVLPVLRHERAVAEQSGLSAVRRAENLSGALAVSAGWAGRLTCQDVLVVDDIVTSGTSLLEAARALRAAGARVHGALTVATTALRLTPAARARAGRSESWP